MVCYHELLMRLPHLVPVRTLPVTQTPSLQFKGRGTVTCDGVGVGTYLRPRIKNASRRDMIDENPPG